MSEVNEVPTYTPPEGVHGPTLGRDLPDGCERLPATRPPAGREWLPGPVPAAWRDGLYWWRFPPLQVGDRVQLTGVVSETTPAHVQIMQEDGSHCWVPTTAALTRVVTP